MLQYCTENIGSLQWNDFAKIQFLCLNKSVLNCKKNMILCSTTNDTKFVAPKCIHWWWTKKVNITYFFRLTLGEKVMWQKRPQCEKSCMFQSGPAPKVRRNDSEEESMTGTTELVCEVSMVVIAAEGDAQYNFYLTHWGRVTHLCVGKQTIIGSDNGLSPEWRQAIILTNAGILLIGPLGTNFSEILIEIQTFSLKKICLKISAKYSSFRLGLNVLKSKGSRLLQLHQSQKTLTQNSSKHW